MRLAGVAVPTAVLLLLGSAGSVAAEVRADAGARQQPAGALAPAAADSGICSRRWLDQVYSGTGQPLAFSSDADRPTGAVSLPDRTRAALAASPQQVSSRPNDTYFYLYQRDSLMAVGALDAWGTSHGGSDVVIAVVGTGVQTTHADLAAKMWRNPGELPGNALDDDGNGYVDDVVGWNFADRTADPSDIPGGRGTMMAGIAAAESNNDEGIAGVSWGARIMALKALSLRHEDTGDRFVGSVGDYVEAVCYAANNGASVILFGGYLQDPSGAATDLERLRLAIEYAHTTGAVVVAPAGDCALPQEFCPSSDVYGQNPPMFPAAFRHVIGVQTYGSGPSARAEGSFGEWVDITAPGEEFMATSADPPYRYVKHQRATSDFGAALVAGVAAVLRSVNPDLTPYRVEEAICRTATRPAGVEFEFPEQGYPRNDQWGCGIVNFERAVETTPPKMRVDVLSPVSLVPGPPTDLVHISDGLQPLDTLRFANGYLSAGAWELLADRRWVLGATSTDRPDGTSTGEIGPNLNALRLETGALQQGSVYTAAIQACPIGWTREQAPCQSFTYRLQVVERLRRAFLPLAGR